MNARKEWQSYKLFLYNQIIRKDFFAIRSDFERFFPFGQARLIKRPVGAPRASAATPRARQVSLATEVTTGRSRPTIRETIIGARIWTFTRRGSTQAARHTGRLVFSCVASRNKRCRGHSEMTASTLSVTLRVGLTQLSAHRGHAGPARPEGSSVRFKARPRAVALTGKSFKSVARF